MSATTSPQKEKACATVASAAAGWVKFDDGGTGVEDGDADYSARNPDPYGSPVKAGADGGQTSRSSSGVSSARGSVNSAVVSPHQDQDEHDGGILAVSEVQVSLFNRCDFTIFFFISKITCQMTCLEMNVAISRK